VTDTSVIATSVGPADVLHRLVLGVEPRNALTGGSLATAVRVGQEVPRRMRAAAARFADPWPCLDFETNGTARFKLRYGVGGGGPNRIKVNPDGSPPTITVRIDDPRRGFVPRRFAVPLWTRLELERADPSPAGGPTGLYIPLASRLLRPYLFPGAAYPIPRGTTAIRGQVVFNSRPVRWPRLFARGPGNVRVGVAHGDERGEFLLVITDLGTVPPPPPSTVSVELDIIAPAPNAASTPGLAELLADLVVENLARSSAPPQPGDLDNNVLRGVSTPTGYIASAAPPPRLTVPVGELLALAQPIVFTP
jgi:hypothetical protein